MADHNDVGAGSNVGGGGITVIQPQGPTYYLGTWDASTNTPTLTSSVAPAGPSGSYYIVSVAGTTTLNGISDWTVGDWVIWNGSIWEKLEGGKTSVTVGSTLIAGGTSGRVLYDNAGTLSEYTITGTAGSVVMSTAPTLVGPVELRSGVNPQILYLYNTYTDASNYERGNLLWSGNTLSLITTNAGTGLSRTVVIGSGSAPGASPGGTNVTVAQSGVSVQRDGTSNSTQFTVGGTGLTSTTQLHTRLTPTINQASGTYTVLDINPTETAIGAGPHYLIKGRIGAGANVFSVTNGGAVTALNVTSTGSTWANIPAAGTAGRMQFVSNAGTKGSMWLDDGTRWKPLNGIATLATLDTASSAIGNTETIVFQYLIPAGMWQVGDRIRIYDTFTKSGTTDTGLIYFRIGTAGTTADTGLISSTQLSAGARMVANIWEFRLESATSLQIIATATGGYGNAATGNVLPAPYTISSATANALYLSVSIKSGGTTDTVTLVDGQMELVSKAN